MLFTFHHLDIALPFTRLAASVAENAILLFQESHLHTKAKEDLLTLLEEVTVKDIFKKRNKRIPQTCVNEFESSSHYNNKDADKQRL